VREGLAMLQSKGGVVEFVELTEDDMRDDLNRLIALLEVNRLRRFIGLVSGGQHLESLGSDVCRYHGASARRFWRRHL
jgi:hypothetical protein